MQTVSENRRILVIDDEQKIRDIFQHIFTLDIENEYSPPDQSDSVPFELVSASQGKEGFSIFEKGLQDQNPFAVAFIDIRMPPGWDGYKTARKIREMDDRVYIIIVTAFADRNLDELQSVIQHNFLLVQKPFSVKEIYQLGRNFCQSWNRDLELIRHKQNLEELVQHRTAELKKTNDQLRLEIKEKERIQKELKYLSIHDSLTGLYNRAYFEEELDRLSKSRQYPISIIIGDVDNLKDLNDLEGHSAGDDLLQAAAQVLRSAFRPEDVVTRIGGDEFAILLPGSDESVVQRAMDRVTSGLDTQQISIMGHHLRISLGGATARNGESLQQIFRQADENMYKMKFKHRS